MTVLITGAGGGLGLELVKRGLDLGYSVVAASRSKSEKLTELSKRHSGNLFTLQMDVTDSESVNSAAAFLQSKKITVDGIINNAAVLLDQRDFDSDVVLDLDLDNLYKTMDVNFFGPIRVLKTFMPSIYQSKTPFIVDIVSECMRLNADIYVFPAYCCSKNALVTYTQWIRNYLTKRKPEHHVRVFMIHPGRMKTPMSKESGEILPDESANGIWNIITGKITVDSEIPYVDYRGTPMDY